MTKKRSGYPWRVEGASIFDANWEFMATTCWKACSTSRSDKHTATAHAHCVARAAYIVETVNKAQERKP